MNKSKHQISKWLDENTCGLYEPPIYDLLHRSLDTYYLKNDKNLKYNNNFKINELKKLNYDINRSKYYDDLIEDKSFEELEYDKDLIEDSNYIHVFRDNNSKFVQFIDQDTRRYHVNMLFNRMIDYCYTNKLVGFKGELLINKKMRNEFVKFCYKNSK